MALLLARLSVWLALPLLGCCQPTVAVAGQASQGSGAPAGEVDARLVSANNTFGFDLLAHLAQAQPDGNIVLSPISIAQCLEAVCNGARGDTLRFMMRALRLDGIPLDDVNAGNARLLTSLTHPRDRSTLEIANSLWVDPARSPVRVEFGQRCRDYYAVELGDITGGYAAINAWVAERTHGLIPALHLEDVPYWRAALVNVTYFRGAWAQRFDRTQTRLARFTNLAGRTYGVPLMRVEGEFSYVAADGIQVVRLPYDDQSVSMLVALPSAGTSWPGFLHRLTPQNWAAWNRKLERTSGVVQLPRFTTSCLSDLVAPVSLLGMQSAFDLNRADFSGIMAGPLCLGGALQATRLEVDEEGTTAAGATELDAVDGEPPTPFVFRADHPFFCAIQDDRTGELLFVALILNPTG